MMVGCQAFILNATIALPRALRIRINPLEEAVRKFVLGAAVKGSQAIIVDAGAGESFLFLEYLQVITM